MSGCWLTCGGSPTTMPEVADTCSLASPASVCRTQHLHLRCSVDFARRALTGTAALTVQSQEENLRSLVRGVCAAPLLRGRSAPALRPCFPRALRSLAFPRASVPLSQLSRSSLPQPHFHISTLSFAFHVGWSPPAPSLFPGPDPSVVAPAPRLAPHPLLGYFVLPPITV